jgi:hypothetical protein
MAVKYDSNLPVANSHIEPIYRQTYNSFGDVDTALVDLTQVNWTAGYTQQGLNTRLNAKTNKGLLAGSVAAVAGDGQIGPCAGDSTLVYDMAVGIVVNDAAGNPYESSSALGSNKIVYMQGSGTVFKTDIYETMLYNATSSAHTITYTAGDKLFASVHGLLTNASGMTNGAAALLGTGAKMTQVGILLQKPTSTDPWMVVQLTI